MKKHYIKAALTLTASLLLYPIARLHAYSVRGYDAIGGEVFIIAAGIVIAALILEAGARRERQKRSKDNASLHQGRYVKLVSSGALSDKNTLKWR